MVILCRLTTLFTYLNYSIIRNELKTSQYKDEVELLKPNENNRIFLCSGGMNSTKHRCVTPLYSCITFIFSATIFEPNIFSTKKAHAPAQAFLI
jgi:hypothetical protein